jgi:hypothetical protein
MASWILYVVTDAVYRQMGSTKSGEIALADQSGAAFLEQRMTLFNCFFYLSGRVWFLNQLYFKCNGW